MACSELDLLDPMIIRVFKMRRKISPFEMASGDVTQWHLKLPSNVCYHFAVNKMEELWIAIIWGKA